MKQILKSTLFIVLLLTGKLSFAHALWVETNAVGVKNQTQTVRVYYGEYATKELEPVDKWYSDVQSFTLWLTTPSKQRIELKKTAGADFFTANFTPTEDGTYSLSVEHAAKDLGGTTKYVFSSLALVNVGKPSEWSVQAPLAVLVTPAVYKVGAKVRVAVVAAGKPLADAEVLVMSGEGWTKAFKTDAKGMVTFPALWKGNYVIEASNIIEQDGLWHNNAFKKTWHGTTTFVNVK
ncbi:DUF4198 domain-containing protein [Sphingobacterium sp. Mn56C]|uniref:DUF4198 domain-containing protein n=1 Tax=Sphingobacterium sp. Mn56C TaxID=3395261 RepID=UPI003BE0D2E4